MIVYEITATVRADLVEEYEKYMRRRHVPDLLATGFFAAAFFTRTTGNRYRIQYHARDENALKSYLERDAARLRDDFKNHFPAGVELAREVWEIVQDWQAD
jgi:hypothetical protein